MSPRTPALLALYPDAPSPNSKPNPLPAHYCQEHQTPFKQYSRGENVWYSRKGPDGKWCRKK